MVTGSLSVSFLPLEISVSISFSGSVIGIGSVLSMVLLGLGGIGMSIFTFGRGGISCAGLIVTIGGMRGLDLRSGLVDSEWTTKSNMMETFHHSLSINNLSRDFGGYHLGFEWRYW